MSPVTRVPSIRSFMRLRVRRKVDLPQPDGPIRAITEHSGMVSEMSHRACLGPYQKLRPRTTNLALVFGSCVICRPVWLRSEMIAEYDREDIRLAPPGRGGPDFLGKTRGQYTG